MQIKEELKQIVGPANLFDSQEILTSYSKDHSFRASGKPDCVVKPANTGEIRDIILLANKHQAPVIPVSSGIHFHGNTMAGPGGIILDLSRMNRVLDVDLDNKMVRIEPGVTWGQLQAALASHKMMALAPLLPHPLKSVLTSHLEREPMLIPKYEYAGPLVSSEVVFPNGDIFRTGSSAVPGFPDKCLAEGVNPGGPGFYSYNWLLQGAQGTMGVVTWGKVKIAPKPTIDKTYIFPFKRLDDAVKLVYSIQKRMLGEECLLLDNTSLAAILATKKSIDYKSLKENLSPWTVIFISGGGWRRPEEKIEYEEEGLREAAAELNLAEIPASIPGLPGVEEELPGLLRAAGPENGQYWKFARGGECQDIFFLTTLDKAEQFEMAMRKTAGENDFSPDDIGFYIQPLEYGRACHFEICLFYNPGNPARVEKARNLYSQAVKKALDMGGFFSRPYGVVADMVFERSTGYTAALKKVKGLFDPNNIMSPGRLSF